MRTLVRGALALALVVSSMFAPPAIEVQGTEKAWRVGWPGNGARAPREANTLTPLREGLRELGYVRRSPLGGSS